MPITIFCVRPMTYGVHRGVCRCMGEGEGGNKHLTVQE